MANIKQQKKRIRTAARQRLENLRYTSTIKTLFRNLRDAVDLGDKEKAQEVYRSLIQLLDRAAARKALHANAAGRKKSQAARLLKQEPKADANVVRKAKSKKPTRKPAATPKARKPEAEAAPAAEATDAVATESTETADETAAKAPAKTAAKKAPAKKPAAKKPAAKAEAKADDKPKAAAKKPAAKKADDKPAAE